MHSITIVVPCYNEATRINLAAFGHFLAKKTIRFIFVNDGSTDDTHAILDLLKSANPDKVEVLHLQINKGKACAVREGILHALNTRNPNLVGFMDADLSTPLSEIRHLTDEFKIKNIDFVFGSRMARIGAKIVRYHHRHYLGRIIATLISIYLKIPVYDSQCGAKFFRAPLARIIFNDPFVSRWLFDVEIFRRIQLTGKSVGDCCEELPLRTWIEKGESKLRTRDLLRIPLEFTRIVMYYRKQKANYPHQATQLTIKEPEVL